MSGKKKNQLALAPNTNATSGLRLKKKKEKIIGVPAADAEDGCTLQHISSLCPGDDSPVFCPWCEGGDESESVNASHRQPATVPGSTQIKLVSISFSLSLLPAICLHFFTSTQPLRPGTRRFLLKPFKHEVKENAAKVDEWAEEF